MASIGFTFSTREHPPFISMYIDVMTVLISLLAVGLAMVIQRFAKPDDRVFFLGNTLSQFICQGWAFCIFMYLCARFNLALFDDQLIAIDHFFGFDWLGYIRWLDALPSFWGTRLHSAYYSILPQCVIMLFLLNGCDYCTHAQRFNIVNLVSGLVGAILATLCPSVGGYGYYNIHAQTLPHLHPLIARMHEGVYLALRHHTAHSIEMPFVGIIGFPSFHVIFAIALMYASLPFTLLRLFFIPLNIIMLVSALSEGGHYLSDVLGGLAVAAIGIYAAERTLPRSRYP